MFILSIDLHSLKSTIRLSFHFQDVTYESLDDMYCSKFSTGFPHFDNHPLATRPVYMDDKARPHRSRAVTTYLQSEAATSVPWPAMSPYLNPIEHIWDMLGRRILAR
jgi:transposase